MEKRSEATALAVEDKNLVKNDSLNLVALHDHSDTRRAAPTVKADLNPSFESSKALPKIELYDSQAKAAEQNLHSINKTEVPQYQGTTAWAALENYSLATSKSPQEQNREAISQSEKPKFQGTSAWAALENYSLAKEKVDHHGSANRVPVEK